MLHAEHLDVGFMLSWFHRRHKVSQRLVKIAKTGQVAKKNETADDGEGCVSAALNGP